MLSYRKELDGLRALAVIAVIIYHAKLNFFGVQIFQGGFFGVDVFFVLSGYLITDIIRKQMDEGRFSFRDFYWRRAKRIIPALVTVILFTSAVAYWILLPDDLITYANSLRSTLYFGSNYFFYGEDSYTAADSIYRPLLHTWSLSVEWQFYVLFPFLVWSINRVFPRYMFGILLALALLSLQASSFIVTQNPDMAFYLLPTRSWELILGGLVTFFDRSNMKRPEKGTYKYLVHQSLPIIGLFLIIHSMLFIGHEVRHPSFVTLLPVIGACIFIMFAYKGELSNDILSLKPFVGIGLISYSLYLWHQPVFVFFRLIRHDYIKIEHFLLLLLISLVFSILTYHLVEKTYRAKVISKYPMAILSIALIVNLLFAYITPKENGFPSRSVVVAELFANLDDNKLFRLKGGMCHARSVEKACRVVKKENNIVLLGDSHAGTMGRHLYNEAVKKGYGYLQLTNNGCTGIDTVIRVHIKDGEDKACTEESKKISAYIENTSTPPLTIVWSARLPLYISGERFDNELGGKENAAKVWIEAVNKKEKIADALVRKFNYWSSLGHKLILIYPIPEMGWDVPHYIQVKLNKYVLPASKKQAYENIKLKYPLATYEKRAAKSFELLDKVKGEQIVRIYPAKTLCSSTECIGNDSSFIYYYDDDHPSTHGAKLIVEQVKPYLP